MTTAYRENVAGTAAQCPCGSREDLWPCNKCGKPACPMCRVGTGSLSDGYWHFQPCRLQMFVRQPSFWRQILDQVLSWMS